MLFRSFQRNVGIGASCIPRKDIEERDRIGVSKMMWGSDYPHPEGTWPHTSTFLQENFSGFPEEDVRAILGENAVKWYGLNGTALSEIAARVGPERDNVLQ